MEDEEKQPFAGAIIILFFVALFIVGGGVYGYLYYTGKVSLPFSGSSSSMHEGAVDESDGSGEGDSYDPSTAEGDINDDGTVDVLDAQYITTHSGCEKEDACWSKVIDKTITGHNPIYTSDLDLNQDGVVNDADAMVITNYSP